MAGASAAILTHACKVRDPDSPTLERASFLPIKPSALGLSLYTVRHLLKADPAGTIQAIAELGIRDCETDGMHSIEPRILRVMMDDNGLVSRSSHIRLEALRTGLRRELEAADLLGQDALFLAWLPPEERTADAYRALADLLNERGETTLKSGVALGYHNHDFEFFDLGGVTGYEILLKRTDPALVDMELDFYWAAHAGIEPVDLFKKAPGRFTSCHLKDRDFEGNMAPVGNGEIGFRRILDHAPSAGLERFYIEHDNP